LLSFQAKRRQAKKLELQLTASVLWLKGQNGPSQKAGIDQARAG